MIETWIQKPGCLVQMWILLFNSSVPAGWPIYKMGIEVVSISGLLCPWYIVRTLQMFLNKMKIKELEGGGMRVCRQVVPCHYHLQLIWNDFCLGDGSQTQSKPALVAPLSAVYTCHWTVSKRPKLPNRMQPVSWPGVRRWEVVPEHWRLSGQEPHNCCNLQCH